MRRRPATVKRCNDERSGSAKARGEGASPFSVMLSEGEETEMWRCCPVVRASLICSDARYAKTYSPSFLSSSILMSFFLCLCLFFFLGLGSGRTGGWVTVRIYGGLWVEGEGVDGKGRLQFKGGREMVKKFLGFWSWNGGGVGSFSMSL